MNWKESVSGWSNKKILRMFRKKELWSWEKKRGELKRKSKKEEKSKVNWWKQMQVIACKKMTEKELNWWLIKEVMKKRGKVESWSKTGSIMDFGEKRWRNLSAIDIKMLGWGEKVSEGKIVLTRRYNSLNSELLVEEMDTTLSQQFCGMLLDGEEKASLE